MYYNWVLNIKLSNMLLLLLLLVFSPFSDRVGLPLVVVSNHSFDPCLWGGGGVFGKITYHNVTVWCVYGCS